MTDRLAEIKERLAKGYDLRLGPEDLAWCVVEIDRLREAINCMRDDA